MTCVLCSGVSDSVTPWTIAHQTPLSMGFSRQEFWSGLPFPSPRTLPDPGIEPMSFASLAPTGGFFFTTVPSGKPLEWIVCGNCITPWQAVMYGAFQREALFLWLGNTEGWTNFIFVLHWWIAVKVDLARLCKTGLFHKSLQAGV